MSDISAALIGQIALFKTISDEVLMVKVIGEGFEKQKSYKVKILGNNEKGSAIDETVIQTDEIKMVCILPPEVQRGLELTISYIPEQDMNKDLSKFTLLGELPDSE